MFCSNCGAKISDDSKFCNICGAKIIRAVAQAPTVSTESAPDIASAQAATPPKDFNSSDDRISTRNPVWAMIYNLAKSPLFLVAAIALTLSLVLTVTVKNDLIETLEYAVDIIDEYSYALGLDDDTFELFEKFIDIIYISLPASILIDTVIVAGMWITVYFIFFARASALKSSGLSAIKVCIIIKEVLLWISLAISEISMLIGIGKINKAIEKFEEFTHHEAPDEMRKGIWIILLIGLLAATISGFVIAFFKGIRRSINTISYTLETGHASYEVSNYSAVICIVLGILSIFSAIMYLTESLMFITLCNGISSLLFGWILFTYRSKMSAAIYAQQSITHEGL
ncbi:MAG: zinc ribbon domain-containing protein [Clostridia bacterium]|nr:zinc ribbon domain-containing protein [Clostridia bacterium]